MNALGIPARKALCALCALSLFEASAQQAAPRDEQAAETAPAALAEPHDAMEKRMLEMLRQNADVRFEHNSPLPPRVVGASARPAPNDAAVVERPPALDPRVLDAVSEKVLRTPQVLDAVKDPRRAALLAGGWLQTDKLDEAGTQKSPDTLRLRYFAYATGRTVQVTASLEGQIRSVTVLPPDHHAALSRAEVQRAEALARASPDAPARLQRLPIARGLALPPEADGHRRAHLLFRDERSLRWHVEAVVDLSAETVSSLQPVQ